MDWENHLEKNPIQKIEKSKNESKIAASEKKLARRQIFFKHPFLTLLQN